MLTVYRRLLYLYPPGHRREFGEEMLAVFAALSIEPSRKRFLPRVQFLVREITGLLRGALQERVPLIAGLSTWPRSSRRFHMQPGFRFPKTTAILMLLILGGVVLAIEKARAIVASLPPSNPPVGPIRPEEFTFFPTITLMFVCFYALGLIGWAVMFALRRSGVHRLDNLSIIDQQK